MSKSPQQLDTFEAMRIKEFRNLMYGRFLFIMALRMMGALVGYWMYELTGNPLAIGLIGLAEVIPAVSLSLHAGYKIDISEKRKLLLTGVLLYLFASILLLILAMDAMSHLFTKNFIVNSIYIIIFFTGIFRSFTGPSFGTLVAIIVPKEILQNGISWSQGTWLSASVFGHALVGFLIAGFGIDGALLVIVLLVIAGFYFMFQLKPHPAFQGKRYDNSWDNITEGLKYVYKTKELLGALTLDLFAVLFGGAVALIPVFAKDILHVGPIGFGWLNAATDLGAIICIVTILKFPLKTNQGKKLLFAVAGFGLCMIVFAISKVFWLSFLALLVSGILDGVSVVVRGTITQLKTPDEMRGRVMSISSMFVNSSNELGQFESGVAARYMGNVASVIFGGMVTIGVATFTWLKIPRLKNLKY
ncbi:MAG: MFS transporter [Chitinophagaceae bacterium]|nr:MFS transporter [Chitinophagaceae bacterium]MBS4043193.1 MFS transporter [Chitinophagaceae bacterium]